MNQNGPHAGSIWSNSSALWHIYWIEKSGYHPCICLPYLDQYVMMFGLSYMTVGVIKVGLPCVITFYPFTADTAATKSNPKLDSQCKCCKYIIWMPYEMENLSLLGNIWWDLATVRVGRALFQYEECCPVTGIPIVNIRWSHDHLIFIIGIHQTI